MKNLFLCFMVSLTASCNGHGPTAPINGTATYEKFTRNSNLSSTTEFVPIKYAEVDAFVDRIKVASGSTREDGTFTINVPLQYNNLSIELKVRTKCTKYNVEVTTHDSTFFNSEMYSISAIVNNWDTPAALVATRDENTGRIAGAFNIYAQIIRGFSWFESHVSWKPKFPSLKVHWEAGNSGDRCSCFFPGILGSHLISIQDLPSNQDDLDDSVILHEVGHYIQKVFSVNHSPGGDHYLACGENDLDPRLAWSEGWADAYAQIVIGNGLYIDNSSTQGYFTADFENLCDDDFGPRSEFTIAAMYIDLVDGSADMPIDQDNDGLAYSFDEVFSGMRRVRGFNPNVLNYYKAMVPEILTRELWNEKFAAIGLDSETLKAQLDN